ncbi:hypothetical protein PFUM301597_22440 [Pseudomonas fluorescens]
MLGQHALDAIRRHGDKATTGQLGETVEVKQLALREQHHERAHGVFQQHCLDLLRGIQAGLFDNLCVRDGELCEQSPNDRRGGQWDCGEGDF